MSLSDLAENVAEGLRREHIAAMQAEQSAPSGDQVLQKEARSGIFAKIHFAWRAEDRLTREQIKVAAKAMFEEQFDRAISLLDNFYNLARDDNGKEHWDRLSATDIEGMLFTLSNLRFTLMPQVNELLLDAIYAKHITDEAYHEHWNDVYDGTQGDKTAKASRESREDKYHSFFRFYLYSTADTFMKEINNFERTLVRIMDWRARGYR